MGADRTGRGAVAVRRPDAQRARWAAGRRGARVRCSEAMLDTAWPDVGHGAPTDDTMRADVGGLGGRRDRHRHRGVVVGEADRHRGGRGGLADGRPDGAVQGAADQVAGQAAEGGPRQVERGRELADVAVGAHPGRHRDRVLPSWPSTLATSAPSCGAGGQTGPGGQLGQGHRGPVLGGRDAVQVDVAHGGDLATDRRQQAEQLRRVGQHGQRRRVGAGRGVLGQVGLQPGGAPGERRQRGRAEVDGRAVG